jgi:hypothetical protein
MSSSFETYWRFGGTYHLPIHGRKESEAGWFLIALFLDTEGEGVMLLPVAGFFPNYTITQDIVLIIFTAVETSDPTPLMGDNIREGNVSCNLLFLQPNCGNISIAS